MKQFNIAGPCVPGEHYIVSPFRGITDELMSLISRKNYFVIHAARQTGKTTLLKELVRKINSEGNYHALYCSLEAIQPFPDPEKAIPEIVYKIESNIENQRLPKGFAKDANYNQIGNVIKNTFVKYCRKIKKPLVIFFDEADCLANGTLISFLRQLREGYINRSDTPFVHSIALVGMRNIRDFKAKIRPDSDTLGSASPFNIITESLNIRNFNKEEVTDLYTQHTAETNQVFETDSIEYAFEQTQGQPWLVNAIARECVEKITKNDYSLTITKDIIIQAIQNIILQRGTHFDSLMHKLTEERVRSIIIPVITGDIINDTNSDAYQFTKDLGLIRDDKNKIEIANPIYTEVMMRTLNQSVQDTIRNTRPELTLPRYIKNDKIDMEYLIKEFQVFWRENSKIWKDAYRKGFYEYDEAAAQLVMQAYLQRVLNGGGSIIREMAANTRRADMCVIYKDQKYPIELKILQTEGNRNESYNQILSYMDTFGSDTGYLVIFDKDTDKPWDEKIYTHTETINGKKIFVAGC